MSYSTPHHQAAVQAVKMLPNGKLPPEHVAEVPGTNVTGWTPAVEALHHMIQAAKTDGVILSPVNGYKDLDAQVEAAKTKPKMAAIPGQSQHGYGTAFDLTDGDHKLSPKACAWLGKNAASFGFKHPDWAKGTPKHRSEPWHWEYSAGM